MAPGGVGLFNPFNPLCAASQCLEQVIGHADNKPVAQFEACVSMFGAPTTTTVASPGETVFSTTTLTVPYTDIIVPVSTAFSTDIVTSTSYTQVLEVVTEYSSTSYATVTTVVPAPVEPTMKRRAVRRRGKCGGPKPSTTSSVPTTSTPAASACSGLAEYSSACSCIYAVSSTATVTDPASTSTSIETVTETSTVPVTSPSTVTVVVPSTVVEPATSTVTSTLTTLFETTTTVTSTAAPSPTHARQPVGNPGFEGAGQGWDDTTGIAKWYNAGALAHSGAGVYRLLYQGIGRAPFATVSQTLRGLRVGGRYAASGWFRSLATGSECDIKVDVGGTSVFEFKAAPAEWAEYTGTYIATSETVVVSVNQTCSYYFTGYRETWVDDVTLTLLD